MADGIRDDTFLHLVDAWWMNEVSRRGAAGLEVELDEDAFIEEGFRDFTDCKGDRFHDSADLAMHFEEWVSLYGGSDHPEARKLIEDVLGYWRSYERS